MAVDVKYQWKRRLKKRELHAALQRAAAKNGITLGTASAYQRLRVFLGEVSE